MKQDEDARGARNPENAEPADDVATLYSWANLHGAKYRDFSASRQEMRAQMRQRTLAERAKIAREEAQRTPASLGEGSRWDDLLPGGSQAAAAAPVRHEIPVERRFEIPENVDRMAGTLPAVGDAVTGTRRGLTGAPYFREDLVGEQRSMTAPTPEPESAEVRPAWLAERIPQPLERHLQPPVQSSQPAAPLAVPAAPNPAPAVQIPVPGAHIPGPAVQMPVNDTLQQSRERVASRWFALRGVFGRSQEEQQPSHLEGQVPVLTVFSLAGGVGKTSLVAAVGRALAGRGERVLLTDTCSFGVLPFYFGAREVKPGVVRTFSGGSSDPAVRVLTLESDRYDADPDLLRREMARGTQDISRVLIDVATGSGAMLRQALRLSPTVLVPVVPDMASVVTLQVMEGFFRNQEGLSGKPLQAWFVLNQFDPSSPLQLDVREVLRQQLGERLLPFAVHRSAAMSEALAEGMTVIDYAPNSPAAEDIMSLVTWIRNISVAISSGHRGMRWSER
ncbi:MAG TPA: cellulose biosynthesis protein BcsQ [Acidobacteriaceae bacterium]|jgi:cellulose synthase operon protein YhjQ|nr:cellulose biosynthesis protein BcsQ [Acidobacteriaceae bacterium]